MLELYVTSTAVGLANMLKSILMKRWVKQENNNKIVYDRNSLISLRFKSYTVAKEKISFLQGSYLNNSRLKIISIIS